MRVTRAHGCRLVAALLGGLLPALAYPPVEATELAWVGLIPLLLLARFSRPAQAFRWGFLGGLVFWLVTLFWLNGMMRTGGAWPVVILAWVLLSAYCALFTGLFLAGVAGLWLRRGPDVAGEPLEASMGGQLVRLVAVPLLWVGCEYARMNLFGGFSWNPLGVSQHANVAVLQVARWGGVYAVSAVVVLMNGALALAGLRLWQRVVHRVSAGPRIQYELMLAFIVVLGLFSEGIRAVRAWDRGQVGAAELRIAAIQANIPQDSKWDGDVESLFVRMEQLTGQALLARPDLVVWPETAMPMSLRRDPVALERLGRLTALGAPLLTGAIDEEERDGRRHYYNSALLIGRDGRLEGAYAKQRLVPFGEFVPFEGAFPFLARLAPLGFSCTPGSTGTVFRLGPGAVGFSALICFEDAMSGPARQAVRNGARFLVNLTNDGWFEGTAEGRQHAAQAVLRAVENRVPMVRCANQGVSGFIDAVGRVDATTRELVARGEAARIDYRVDRLAPAAAGALTPYTRHGDWLLALPALVLTVVWLLWLAWAGRVGRGGGIVEQGAV